jgi:hypothetical protein
MKKLLAITLLIASTSVLAFPMIDFTCQNDCISSGHMYQYCQQLCTYYV